ncbi:MAG: S8 family peptidase [Bdellovibrionales bacterium]
MATRPLSKIFFLLTGMLALSACGKQKTSSGNYSKPAEECVADVVPQNFIVRYLDGRIERVQAPSEAEFLRGFFAENQNQIETAEPDYFVRNHVGTFAQDGEVVTTSDNWGMARVHAEAMWAQGQYGSGVIVAVVDSGMDISHAQFSARVAKNVGEVGLDAQGHDKATNGIDDDGNGLVDDAGGWDFVDRVPLTKDHQYHGTHVAGVIAAEHADTVSGEKSYVQGLAPLARILPLSFLDSSGSGFMSNGVLAIEYAVQRGAKVINASWGGSVCSKSLRDIVSGLAARGVVFVSAAGNEGKNIDLYKSYPASLDFAAQLTVGAVGAQDLLTTFSNYGPKTVHIFSPGSKIISTIPGQRMAALSGTSMAAPFVSGAVALLLGAEPSATVDQIRQALYRSAHREGSYINASQGRLDMAAALAELRRQMGK